ncbi:PLDc N-terminal domain-containing protein [Myroides sp. LJL115]
MEYYLPSILAIQTSLSLDIPLFLWQLFSLIPIGLIIYAIYRLFKSKYSLGQSILFFLLILVVPVLGSIVFLSVDNMQRKRESQV